METTLVIFQIYGNFSEWAEIFDSDEAKVRHAEYEIKPLEQYKPRVCAPLTECDSNTEYQSNMTEFNNSKIQNNGISHIIRKCVSKKICNSLQYQSASATDSTPGECTKLNICGPNKWEKSSPIRNSDGIYTTPRICGDENDLPLGKKWVNEENFKTSVISFGKTFADYEELNSLY